MERKDMKPNDLRMYFGSNYKIDLKFEAELIGFLKKYGFEWWACSTDHVTGVRNICFEKNSERQKKPIVGNVISDTGVEIDHVAD